MAHTTANVNIPFEIAVSDDVRQLSFVDDWRLDVRGVYATAAKAKRMLKKHIAHALSLALDTYAQRHNRAIIACTNGTILVVSHDGPGWGYTISYKGSHGCSCLSSGDYTSTLKDAMQHAEQSYGGVEFIDMCSSTDRAARQFVRGYTGQD